MVYELDFVLAFVLLYVPALVRVDVATYIICKCLLADSDCTQETQRNFTAGRTLAKLFRRFNNNECSYLEQSVVYNPSAKHSLGSEPSYQGISLSFVLPNYP
jgi:hypothetical protein